MTDEHGKQRHFSVSEKRAFFRRKGPHNMAVALQGCFVTGSLYVKRDCVGVRHRSMTMCPKFILR